MPSKRARSATPCGSPPPCGTTLTMSSRTTGRAYPRAARRRVHRGSQHEGSADEPRPPAGHRPRPRQADRAARRGTATSDSRTLGGAQFTVELPLAAPEALERSPTHESSAARRRRRRRPRRRASCTRASSATHRTARSSPWRQPGRRRSRRSAPRARPGAARHLPPRVLGARGAARVRSSHQPQPEFIAVTAARDFASVRDARLTGVRHYLVKPFSVRELNVRVTEVVRELTAGPN